MEPVTYVMGDQEITLTGNIVAKIEPASPRDIKRVLKCIATQEEHGFVLARVDLGHLKAQLDEVNARIIEIGFSMGMAGGARMLRIRDGDTKIYIAGCSHIPGETEEPGPDALGLLQKENADLKDRLAEYELRAGGA